MSNIYQLAHIVKREKDYMLCAVHKGEVQVGIFAGQRQAYRAAQMHIASINHSRRTNGNKKRQVRQDSK